MNWKHRSAIIQCLELVLDNPQNPYLVVGKEATTRWVQIAEEMSKLGHVASHRGCKEKIDELVRLQRDQNLASIRASGTAEDYNRMCALLESLINVC